MAIEPGISDHCPLNVTITKVDGIKRTFVFFDYLDETLGIQATFAKEMG